MTVLISTTLAMRNQHDTWRIHARPAFTLAFTLALALLLAAPLGAQARDSAAFRPGQWGAEFNVGSDFGAVGVQRFRTATHALVADLTAYVSDASGDGADRTDLGNAALRLGSRWYRPIAPSVQRFVTVGVLGSVDRAENETDMGVGNRYTTIGAGAFADVGALWLVLPRLSLGASWEASVTRSRRTDAVAGQAERTTNRTTIVLGQARLRLGLFF
jgi:hypothetical protein